MGVVVNLNNNKYYVHRVIMPNDAVFKFDIKKDTNQEMRKGVPSGSLADATRLVSNNSIPNSSEKVNHSDEKNAKKSLEISSERASLPDEDVESPTLSNVNNNGYGDVVKYKLEDEEEPDADINEERDSLPDKIDNFDIWQYNLYTVSDEFVQEVDQVDRASFARSLSNKTRGIKKNETRSVTLYCAKYIYVFNATGYMVGNLIKRVGVEKYTKNKKIRSNSNGRNGIGKSIGYNALQKDEGSRRRSSGIDVHGDGRNAGENAKIFDDARKTDRSGYSERDGENNHSIQKIDKRSLYNILGTDENLNSIVTLTNKKDSSGDALYDTQVEFFKESKARDADENLLLLYHGTAFSGDIGIMTHGPTSNGFLWATSFYPEAENYSKSKRNGNETGEGRILPLYANAKNPKIINAGTALPSAPEDFIDRLNDKENDSYIIIYDLPHYWSYFDEPTKDVSPDYYGLPKGTNLKKVYDENKGKMYVVAVRSSKQFKRTDNLIPTEDNNIRYSLPDEDVESPTLSNVNKERERYKASPKDKVFT